MKEGLSIQPLLDAYRKRHVGRVAWELCKLSAAMERMNWSEGDADEMPRMQLPTYPSTKDSSR